MSKKSKTKFEDLKIFMDMMPISICVVQVETDEKKNPIDFEYLYANKAFLKLYKAKEEDYLNKSFSEVYRNPNRNFIYAVWKSACQGKNFEFEHHLSDSNLYIKVISFLLAKNICGCVVEDNTVNHKLTEIVQKLGKDSGKNYI